MPLYVYRCRNCGHKASELLKIAEATPLKECPACERPSDYEKQVTAGQPPVFKGTGYYVTDFRGRP